MREVTVVGGGLAGLVAAITAAEEGASSVKLFEAHRELGGRARSTDDGGFVANFGPHALYKGLSNWKWLKERGLLGEVVTPRSTEVRFYWDERGWRRPPLGLVRSLPLLVRKAPVDRDFRSWASAAVGERNAGLLCGYAGVISFHHDAGSLSAAFVAERFRWVYLPPSVRFVKGGWGRLVDRLVRRALELGVSVQTGERVDELPQSPVILATELTDARELLGDEGLTCEGGTVVMLDLGLSSRRGDPGAVVDLEQGVLIERYSSHDGTVAPDGQEILQAHIGIERAAAADRGVARIERVLDGTFAGWRDRIVWRRRQIAVKRSGAVDLPGQSWRDRPEIDRGGGVFLAGDMVRAPGYLSEVSFTSAQEAAKMAVAWQSDARPQNGSSRQPHLASG